MPEIAQTLKERLEKKKLQLKTCQSELHLAHQHLDKLQKDFTSVSQKTVK